MVSLQVLTQQYYALNVWLITGIFIMLMRGGAIVNGQRSAADYGPSNGNSPSSGGAGETGNNGEVLLAKTSPLTGQEPTCEELRAMWRFSKRQSRAAEVTNEIPTYRDPFAYNIWEPYIATTRSIGGVRLSPRYRDSARPVYGRVLHREPLATLIDRNRGGGGGVMDDYPRGSNAGGFGLIDGGGSGRLQQAAQTEPRRRIQFRFAGYGPGGAGSNAGGGNAQNLLTAHHGSFQKLKELIWTERARELASQRKAEELAARAAVLKDIANGQSFALRRQLQQEQQQNLAGSLADENRNPDTDHSAGLSSVVSLPGAQRSTSSLNAMSIGKQQQTLGHGGLSGNGAGTLRSGGVHFPLAAPTLSPAAVGNGGGSASSLSSHSIGQLRTYGYRQPGASIFRERNRALYRQALASQPLPSDYYQRDLRKASDTDDDTSNSNGISVGSSSNNIGDMVAALSSSPDELINTNYMFDDGVGIGVDNIETIANRDMSPDVTLSRNDDILSSAMAAAASNQRQFNQHHRKQQQQSSVPLNIRDFIQSYYEQQQPTGVGAVDLYPGHFMNYYF